MSVHIFYLTYTHIRKFNLLHSCFKKCGRKSVKLGLGAHNCYIREAWKKRSLMIPLNNRFLETKINNKTPQSRNLK